VADKVSKRLLIVDDEPAIAEMLREHFRGRFEVETVSSGPDALRAVARQRPDLVFLDINMPRMNGVEVLKGIKRIDPSIAVVMVTASERTNVTAEALQGGAFGYMPKPFDLRYLDHMVAAALGSA
jgi:CheY-like chemotaxis protein